MTTTPREPKHAINQDAREFGLHMRQGGWRLGLLVARNVVVSPGRVSPETLLPKVNATEFARRAGVSNDRVLRHLAAWERAANAGLVPHSATLNPGTEVDLDVERLPAWGPIYNAPLERRTPAARAPRPAAAPVTTRTADPITPPTVTPDDDTDDQQVSRAAESVRAREFRQQVEAVRDPHWDPDAAQDARVREWSEDVRYAINAVLGHTRRLFDAARDPEWADPVARRRAATDLLAASKQLAVIAEIAADPASGNVTDEAIAALIA